MSTQLSSRGPHPRLLAYAVFLLILFYIWWLRFHFRYAWVAIYALVLYSHMRHGETPANLGFRATGFRECIRQFGPWLLLAAAALTGVGIRFGFRPVTWQLGAGSLLLSCAWGLFQQYLLNGFFLNRLRSPLVVALLFAIAHTPNWFLMIVTLLGGWLSAQAYLRYRNLPFLGLAHGVISFLIYLVVPDSITHHLYVGPKY